MILELEKSDWLTWQTGNGWKPRAEEKCQVSNREWGKSLCFKVDKLPELVIPYSLQFAAREKNT